MDAWNNSNWGFCEEILNLTQHVEALSQNPLVHHQSELHDIYITPWMPGCFPKKLCCSMGNFSHLCSNGIQRFLTGTPRLKMTNKDGSSSQNLGRLRVAPHPAKQKDVARDSRADWTCSFLEKRNIAIKYPTCANDCRCIFILSKVCQVGGWTNPFLKKYDRPIWSFPK